MEIEKQEITKLQNMIGIIGYFDANNGMKLYTIIRTTIFYRPLIEQTQSSYERNVLRVLPTEMIEY